MSSRTKAESCSPSEKQDAVEVTSYTFKDTPKPKRKSDSALLSLCMGDVFLKVSNDVKPELSALAIRALRSAV